MFYLTMHSTHFILWEMYEVQQLRVQIIESTLRSVNMTHHYWEILSCCEHSASLNLWPY